MQTSFQCCLYDIIITPKNIYKDIDIKVTTPYNKNGGESKVTTHRIRVGLRIPMNLNTELILKAKESGISKNALILQILWKWEEEKKKAAGQEKEVI